jgi:hypothetical protein
MNIELILRESWRITWKHWRLWFLILLVFAASLPAGLLAGALGGAAGLMATPLPGPQPAWLRQLRLVPGTTWAAIAAGMLIALIVTGCISWIVQAAFMRGAAMAAEKGAFTLPEALRLGRRRIASLITVGAITGTLISVLGLLPPLLLLAGQRTQSSILGMRGAQMALAPLNIVLGVVALFVMMAIALEDLTPRAAFRRGWQVFKTSWWAFLLVMGGALIAGVAVGLVIAILIIPIIVGVTLSILGSPMFGGAVVAAGVLIMLAVAGPALLFTTVFTTVLYTLIYRDAARLTPATV